MKKSDEEYIRERAEQYGLNIGDSDLVVLTERWQSDPLCNLDDLLAGLRKLSEAHTAQMLAATRRALQKQAVEEGR